ncbi:unnamed protein product [Eruca vesicaria subsp. sativa]|uniref:Uncharacterized protein n=1 Tax=Eruca vesicaria subsp. sativa TaxID=29727 RepID=A0ABC8M9Z9_ERUVS|nr:unnamed protein product [Eruca vesicaria subsp. sativa]
MGSLILVVWLLRATAGAYSISSGYNSTHILLNPTLDLIANFKASLPNDSLALTNNDSSQWSVGSATSVRARFFVTNERLTIREIIDTDLNSDVISFGSGEFSVTPLSKRKNQEDHDTSLEDQHSVSKKPSQKKIKGE